LFIRGARGVDVGAVDVGAVGVDVDVVGVDVGAVGVDVGVVGVGWCCFRIRNCTLVCVGALNCTVGKWSNCVAIRLVCRPEPTHHLKLCRPLAGRTTRNMASSSPRVQVFVVQASFNDVYNETQAVFDTLDAATTFMRSFVDLQPDVRFDRVTIYRDEDLPGGISVQAQTAPDGHGVGTEVRLWIQGAFRYI
jgi:hypothetical protein